MALSSINQFPTFKYSQPEDYRFSHDSVFLARRVFEFIEQENWWPRNAIDIGAGCGIIGLDLLFHLRAAGIGLPKHFDFLEVQMAYHTHFQNNVSSLGPVLTRCQFINDNYAHVSNPSLASAYDLIVCNPPYFSKDNGKLPPRDLKLRSRFFIDSDLPTLINFVYQKLSHTGSAFILIRNQLEHNHDQLEDVNKLCDQKLNVKKLKDIRGTHLVQLTSLD